ncbi:alpha-ketoglutarate-dependent dioxygenase alkB homolog 4 [Antechinus flavipes]|uniref:alpha-ketoglutarate-dependent dioxygenase alkB homolog 4 n=1 Tax=Antechinus flavipes TaxID=38775 RepID=UPI0022354B5D|nr:alpha-ketoglutarate-dependent dioxygenase alkB homolog 4 [Antechinus flavipes]
MAAAAAGGESRGDRGARPRDCGCKGVRSCLLCERERGGGVSGTLPPQKSAHFIYCPETGLAVGRENSESAGWAFPFPGVTLIRDFVSAEEEAELVRLMDQDDWKLSQSGRRKQDYGPRVNFRKQKLKPGSFAGLPSFSREIVQRMGTYPVLERFLPVEQCNLDYHPERGSAIDPHLDDSWLWGERLVSLNLLSPTVLSMSQDSGERLQLLSVAQQRTRNSGPNDPKTGDLSDSPSPRSVPCDQVEVAIRLPARSLLVLSGAARYQWKHAIHRQYIESHRICATFRELSAEFCPGGKQGELGQELLEIALSFQGKPV